MVKNVSRYISRFDTVPAYVGDTDRQTDRQKTARQNIHTPRCAKISCY